MQVWDTGGQQRYRPVLSTCYRNAHGVLMVFDVTSEKSFANLPQWIKEVDEFTSSAARPVPRLLVGNKSDLEDRRRVASAVAGEFAREMGFVAYMETSAIATTNINEAFIQLVGSADATEQQD